LNVDTATVNLNNGIDDMNGNLSAAQTDLDNDLSDPVCGFIPACVGLRQTTSALDTTGADFSSVS